MFATIGTLAALHHRDRTGEGQLVDTAITESVFALMESSVSEYGRVGVVRERTGNVLPKIAPSNVYPTKGGGYLVIGANQDKVFARLAQVMGRPELCEDPRYATHAARSEHQQELDALVAAWTQGYGKQELWEFLNAAGVPAGPIYSIADIFEDPQFKARGMIRTLRDEEIGEVEQPAIVPRLSKTPGVLRWAGRIRPGKDNGEIFRRVLELSADEVSNLRRDGVI